MNKNGDIMKIGKFEILPVDGGLFSLDGGAMFGVIPKALWSKAYNQGDDINRIPLAARPLLIKFDNRNILIDTGNGTKFNDKFAEMYNIDKQSSDITLSLSALGVKSEEITDVIFTHLHFDHAGGATYKKDNEILPSFPNAKHYVQKEHLNWANYPSYKDKASFLKENWEPIQYAGMVELTDGPGSIIDKGIELIPVHGHTPAMQLVKISSEGSSLLFCADFCPTSAHLGTAYSMGYDNFPLTVIEEKQKLLPQLYEEGTILFFEHDAFTKAAKITQNKDKFIIGERIDF